VAPKGAAFLLLSTELSMNRGHHPMPTATAFWRRNGVSPMATGHPAVFGTPA